MFIFKAQSLLVKLCFVISSVCMLYLMIFISLDVILRSFGISYFVGVVDLSEYSLLAIALLCAPWVYRINSNLKVDVFLMGRSERFRKKHEHGVNIVILFLSLIVLYYSSVSLLDSIDRGRYVFKMLVFPEWYINWIIPFSMLLMSIEAIFKLFFGKEDRGSV